MRTFIQASIRNILFLIVLLIISIFIIGINYYGLKYSKEWFDLNISTSNTIILCYIFIVKGDKIYKYIFND